MLPDDEQRIIAHVAYVRCGGRTFVFRPSCAFTLPLWTLWAAHFPFFTLQGDERTLLEDFSKTAALTDSPVSAPFDFESSLRFCGSENTSEKRSDMFWRFCPARVPLDTSDSGLVFRLIHCSLSENSARVMSMYSHCLWLSIMRVSQDRAATCTNAMNIIILAISGALDHQKQLALRHASLDAAVRLATSSVWMPSKFNRARAVWLLSPPCR